MSALTAVFGCFVLRSARFEGEDGLNHVKTYCVEAESSCSKPYGTYSLWPRGSQLVRVAMPICLRAMRSCPTLLKCQRLHVFSTSSNGF